MIYLVYPNSVRSITSRLHLSTRVGLLKVGQSHLIHATQTVSEESLMTASRPNGSGGIICETRLAWMQTGTRDVAAYASFVQAGLRKHLNRYPFDPSCVFVNPALES